MELIDSRLKPNLPGYLSKIIERKEISSDRPGFYETLEAYPGLAIIAEIKRSSPSEGTINPKLDPVAFAQTYEAAGAAAISVVTEPHYFQGNLHDLAAVTRASKLPVLMKDFIVDELEIYQAKALGASAVLLIASLLQPRYLRSLIDLAFNLNLDVVIEVHTEPELELALETDAIIGVNNRDLASMRVNLNTMVQLGKLIPKNRVWIAESGVETADDIALVAECGAKAVLIGTSLCRQEHPGAKLKSFVEAAQKSSSRYLSSNVGETNALK